MKKKRVKSRKVFIGLPSERGCETLKPSGKSAFCAHRVPSAHQQCTVNSYIICGSLPCLAHKFPGENNGENKEKILSLNKTQWFSDQFIFFCHSRNVPSSTFPFASSKPDFAHSSIGKNEI